MQTTPFKHVQYHKDGRHFFTVQVEGQTKRFTTTDSINTEQALLNALKWREVVTGLPLAEPDRPKVTWFAQSVDNPDADRPIKVAEPVPQPRKMIIPEDVLSRLEGKAPPPKDTNITRSQPLKAMLMGRNRKYPSLPAGVTPMKMSYQNNNSPSYTFVVNYRLNGKTATKRFYMGIRDSITLSKYRAIRHVAICFRREYLLSVAQKRDMDIEAFVNYYDKLRDGTFPWPFKGTVPGRMSSRKMSNGRTVFEFQTKRMSGQNPKHPSLPLGVSVKRQRKEGKVDQIIFQVSYADLKGNTKVKTYYVGVAGKVDLRRYRMARHAAMAFRKEYLDARITKRPMRLELFDNWKEKILNGTFHVPFHGTTTDTAYFRPVSGTQDKQAMLNGRAGIAAQNVIETLRGVPELMSALNGLSDERLTEIALMIRSPVNEALYAYQKK